MSTGFRRAEEGYRTLSDEVSVSSGGYIEMWLSCRGVVELLVASSRVLLGYGWGAVKVLNY